MIILILFLMGSSPVCFSNDNVRTKENFDFGWKFHLGDIKEAASTNYNDAQWEEVQLPHDWSIGLVTDSTMHRGGSMGFFPGGIGWYRKTFEVPEAYKGQKISILFDGVYHQSDVYINGKHLGFYPYGYIGFEYDLTPYLKYGKENTIAVRVDHSNCPTSRWYSGSGIYRHVWLNVAQPIHIPTWGTYVTTPVVTKESAEVKLVTTIENYSSPRKKISLESIIEDAGGKQVATTVSEISITKKGKNDISQSLTVKSPVLWSVDQPYLYRIKSLIKADGQVIDQYETPLGIRYFEYDPDKGFSLNGVPMKMKGMNVHHDAGSFGAAVPDRSYERRLQILKEYGCNAIRCSHNPPSPEFLDLCDQLGFLVIDESFDKWKSGYYGEYFDKWWQKDLDAMLRRDRNHPSIIMWSVGNEVGEQGDNTGVGVARAKMLQDYVHKTEPTRPVMVAIAPGSNMLERTYNKSGFTEALDIVGYNYQEPWYVTDKEQFPNRIMFGSEVYPYYRGREGKAIVRDYSPKNPWYDVVKNDFIFGQFLWTGIDYFGESSGWPSKGWPTGLFDICMFEKPSASFHRSVWNDQPMVSIAVVDQSLDIDPGKDHWAWPYLASHWNFPQYKGHIILIQTVSNCQEVEVKINGNSMGKRKVADYDNNTIPWHVPYAAGTIEAISYNNGNEAARHELKTSGAPHRIVLSPDRSSVKADGQDVSHITVTIVDKEGIPVPNQDIPITIKVTGNGKLIGLDSGDLRNNTPYKTATRTTYFGKALALIQASRTPGEITVEATGKDMPISTTVIFCK
ncbi:sugar-binding domain-containing protein [Parabacteroides sp. PM6-13]|uniref:sugar-binding domain-containing protein n=1 Tax=unclassified Parabacteroides TaxID=2649774 RepID=UPI0032AE9F03